MKDELSIAAKQKLERFQDLRKALNQAPRVQEQLDEAHERYCSPIEQSPGLRSKKERYLDNLRLIEQSVEPEVEASEVKVEIQLAM